MNHFYIITNESKDKGLETTEMIQNYLMKRGKVCYIRHSGENSGGRDNQTRPDTVPADVECIIVLGGDGTLLRAARNLRDRNIPFLGINLGTLGYLTEGDRSSVTAILDRVIADEYIVEERMMLCGHLLDDNGDRISQDVALNDLTLKRWQSPRMFEFKVYVNGEFLYLYKADGIIISTPTGSTAYNLSCGGPVVEPTAKLFLVTPIAPHSLNNRSLILSSTDTIELEVIGSDKDTEDEKDYVAYFDGDSIMHLRPGCRIEVVRARQEIRVMKLSKMSFLETLRIKMS